MAALRRCFKIMSVPCVLDAPRQGLGGIVLNGEEQPTSPGLLFEYFLIHVSFFFLSVFFSLLSHAPALPGGYGSQLLLNLILCGGK